ncbi:MAG: site-specific integrase [Desulfobacterales bacterium]
MITHKGGSCKVEPIRLQKDIDRIKNILKDQPRNLALFMFGINTNLRASDLVRITVNQVSGLKPGDSFEIREQKTGKPRRITLNSGLHQAVNAWLDVADPNDDDPLFRSQRGAGLAVSSVHRLVKGWCRQIGLRGNYGSHTLRKTWGYHAWKKGIDIPRLMVIFNHSSQKQTLDYLCIQAEEIREVYLKVEL